MKKKRKPTPTYKALRLRLGIFALALWLAAMSLLTWAVASDMQHQLKNQSWDLMFRYNANDTVSPDGKPVDLQLMNRIGRAYAFIHFDQLLPFVLPSGGTISSSDPLWGNWNTYYGFEAAELFHEEGTNALVLKNESAVTFTWFSEGNWESKDDSAPGHGYIYPPKEMEKLLSDYPIFLGANMLFDVLRMKGHFMGDRFIPTSIDSGRVTHQNSDRNERLNFARLMDLDSRSFISWHNQYTAAEEGTNTVTIYCCDVSSYLSPLQPVTIDGRQYTDITEAYLASSFEESNNLLCTRIVHTVTITQNGQRFLYTLLVRAWPLEYAVRRLWPTYLVSALLVLVAVWLLSWRIRRSLTNPLSQLTQWELADVEHAWQEPRLLQETLTDLRQELAETKTKLQQTQTALEYSQSAEQSRKQLISALAHELKTPLAVIHSYSEALQLGISPERQAHYISVLQEESRRIDAMVLEMLELSRLEAGKVHLATDRVALLQLVKAVEEKLSPLAEEKQIRFAYPLVEEFTLLADEARIEQVLTNLMGNAIKYSPPGATVSVKVFRDGSAARFKIQNPSPPLSNEALEKVWDSFYRADPARSQPGTGLGLALVKTIVELHRGKCAVRNVQLTENDVLPTGVEFSLSLPLE